MLYIEVLDQVLLMNFFGKYFIYIIVKRWKSHANNEYALDVKQKKNGKNAESLFFFKRICTCFAEAKYSIPLQQSTHNLWSYIFCSL